MSTRSIESERDRLMLLRYLERHELPMTVEVSDGRKRSTQQNRLQRQWMNDIAAQRTGDSPEYWRGYCKLHFGVPIRKNASETFAKAYDADIRPLPYELKLKLMMVPHDLPVTRDMNAKQMTEYLDAIQKHFSEQGIVLTDPDALRWGQFEKDQVRR